MTVKRKNIALAFLFLLIACSGFTQEKNKTHLSFRSIFQEGIVTGESGTDLQLQFVNGVTYKILFAGAGIGLDYYYERSVPLFLDLRGKVFNRPSAPFLFADGGILFYGKKQKRSTSRAAAAGGFMNWG